MRIIIGLYFSLLLLVSSLLWPSGQTILLMPNTEKLKQELVLNETPQNLSNMLIHLGLTETPLGSNRGKYIDNWNEEIVGVKGVPWCATSLSIAMNSSIPELQSGRALDFKVSGYSLPIKSVLTGNYLPKAGDIIVWSYGGGAGHVDIVIHYNSSDSLQTFTKFGLDEVLKPKEWLVVGGNRSDRMALAKFRTNRAIDKGLKYITPVNYE